MEAGLELADAKGTAWTVLRTQADGAPDLPLRDGDGGAGLACRGRRHVRLQPPRHGWTAARDTDPRPARRDTGPGEYPGRRRVVGSPVTRSARGPMGPRGLRHVALRSRDLCATERFYVDVLGLRVAFPHQGMLFLESPGGGDLLNFIAARRAFDPGAGGFDHLGLRVPAAGWRAAMARLRQAGVRIQGRRGRDAVYVRDPNGYTVELYRD